MENILQLIIALQIANITATFGILYRMGIHAARIDHLDRK